MRSLPRPEGASPPHARVVSRAVTTCAPTPDLPRGAGGPLARAAGRVSQGAAAFVLEPDPLVRLLTVSAVIALGFAVSELPAARRGAADGAAPTAAAAVAAVFVPLDHGHDCRRLCAEARAAAGSRPPGLSPAAALLVVGYGRGPLAPLAAHRAHGCADLVLRLCAAGGQPRLAHLPAADPVSAAGLSAREADVLVLLLAGCTTAAVAAHLCVAQSTARTHCRAVLRKFGAGDRRALRARLLAGPGPASPGLDGASPAGVSGSGLRFV